MEKYNIAQEENENIYIEIDDDKKMFNIIAEKSNLTISKDKLQDFFKKIFYYQYNHPKSNYMINIVNEMKAPVDSSFLFTYCRFEGYINFYGDIFNNGYESRFIGGVKGLEKLDVSEVENMNCIFQGVRYFNLKELNNWNVGNVKYMNSLFKGFSLQEDVEQGADISNWDVSNVLDMGSMFEQVKLDTINLSNWDVSNVLDMGSMFESSTIKGIELKNWNLEKVINLSYMFNSHTIKEINLDGWIINKDANTHEMFSKYFKGDINIKGYKESKLKSDILYRMINKIVNKNRNLIDCGRKLEDLEYRIEKLEYKN